MALIEVPSPPPRLPRYGLVPSVGGEAAIRAFTAANAGDGGPDRWENGFTFRPGFCRSETGLFDPTCAVNDADLLPTNSPEDFVDYQPFAITDGVQCSTFGGDMEEFRKQARDQLLSSTSYKLGQEFWTGTWVQAQGYSNNYLTNTASDNYKDLGTASSSLAAIVSLQDTLGTCSQESRGMLHASTIVVAEWVAAGVVRREGDVLLDMFNNIVVPYAGREPAAYATGMVDVRLSEAVEVQFIQGPNDGTGKNNYQFALAWRVGAVTWDGCCHIHVGVDSTQLCDLSSLD